MTSLTVHVPQDLGTSDTDTVNSGQDGITDVSELESGGEVGQETGLMSEVDEFEGVLEGDLEDLLERTAGQSIFRLMWAKNLAHDAV